MSELSRFLRASTFFLRHAEFEASEREYKLRLAGRLAAALEAMAAGEAGGSLTFERAWTSRDNNLVDWRRKAAVLEDLNNRPAAWRRLAAGLLNGTPSPSAAFDMTCSTLESGGIQTAGAQLIHASTIIGALDLPSMPPVRITVFEKAQRLVGHPEWEAGLTAGELYRRALGFLDLLMAEGPAEDLPLRDRLDAQAICWCMTGGWKEFQDPMALPYTPAPRPSIEEAVAREEIDREPDPRNITSTEREALIKARMGQGRFREQLIKVWGSCAVSGCEHPGLLVASHIKPWSKADNNERLDPYNGLLLSPLANALFDRGMITFDDTGAVVISRELPSADRKRLGVSSKMRLSRVPSGITRYLEYHRKHVFRH